MLAAERWGEDGVKRLGSPYRLSAGEELVIGAGPLALAGRDWYWVSHADDEINWTRVGESGVGVAGWIAANDPESEFIRLVAAASDAGFLASGVGAATTSEVPPLPGPGERAFHIHIAHPDPAQACDIVVTDNTGAALFDTTIVGWAGAIGADWPGDGNRLQIETECTWSLRVFRSL